MENNATQNNEETTGFFQIVQSEQEGKTTLKLIKINIGKVTEAIRSEFIGPPKSLAEALLA